MKLTKKEIIILVEKMLKIDRSKEESENLIDKVEGTGPTTLFLFKVLI